MKRQILFLTATLLLGITIGGYLFSDTQPRSFLAITDCENTCMNPNELAGLLTSVGIQKLPDLIPQVVRETDKVIVIKHPNPQSTTHYVFFPKTDIKDISDISEGKEEYITEIFNVMRDVIQKEDLRNYKVISNGADIQLTRYLHFHLMAE